MEDYVKIFISDEIYTILDVDNDFLKLNRKPSLKDDGRGHLYAVFHYRGKKYQLHRFIMNCPSDMQVDHINGNGLDNRRSNLRICTRSQNQHNRGAKGGASKYKGVYKNEKGKRKWMAKIWVNSKGHYLGSYNTEKEAAEAYNKAAKIHHGQFAKFNKITNIIYGGGDE